MLNRAVLLEILNYDPLTGVFTWKVRSGRAYVGAIAGWVTSAGYRKVRIVGRNYFAHRLAWLYVHGAWPKGLLDHINFNKDDNRILNLRLCSQAQNRAHRRLQRTNTSGVTGVMWRPDLGKWVAYSKRKHLGCFTDLKAAAKAYKRAAVANYGEFAPID